MTTPLNGSGLDVADLLRNAGLKPTRQRMALGSLLFVGAHKHVTPERLFDEARAAGTKVSLATVYNALHQFEAAGLLRTVNVDSDQRWFDTNVDDHHHFLIKDGGELIDILGERLKVAELPAPPEGYEVDGVDIVVRLRPIAEDEA
jgi:Fur family iron response transcriptional regulator